jgi:hypothetical protein
VLVSPMYRAPSAEVSDTSACQDVLDRHGAFAKVSDTFARQGVRAGHGIPA